MTKDKDTAELSDRLFEIFCSVSDPEEMKLVLEELFTPTQLNAAAERIEIARLLKSRFPVRAIAARLGVSSKTVSRVNNRLYKASGYKIAFRRWEEWVITPSLRHPRSKT